jgi:carboxypeptidase Q
LYFSEEGTMTQICRRFLASLTIVLFSISLVAQQGQPAAQTPATAATAAVSQRTDADRSSYRKAMEEADQKIADEVKAHSELMKNLEYLTTQIGARLTGSPQMQAASDWTLKRFKDYGIDAHLETAQISHGWTRGLETAEITSPIQKRIGIHAFGWSKATDGEVSGEVLLLNIEKPEDFDQYKGKLKGKIVMLRKPGDMSKLDPNPDNAYDAVITPQR